MKKKLSKLLRFKTQEFSRQKNESIKRIQKSNINIKLNKKFNKCFQNLNQSVQHTKFNIERLNRTGQIFTNHKQNIKLKKGIIKKQLDKLDKQNITTLRHIFTNNTQKQNNNYVTKTCKKITITKINEQLHKIVKLNGSQGLPQILYKIQQSVQKMIQQVYFYSRIQSLIKVLNQKTKLIGSKTFSFLVYSFSALIFYFYGNYSLSIFYFDKALKKKQQIQSNKIQQRLTEVEIYKTIAKIFLQKNQAKVAKQFAYKYLRKAWYCQNIDQELNAYDILGKIYKECQQKDMSIYFHTKMCRGQTQNKEIIRLSNYELQKCQKQLKQFAVYQTIQVFVQKDQIFHQMLQDRYKVKKISYVGQQSQIKNKLFLHTNRSPNRNLNSYRILERKMIQQKKSKELHFIKPRQTPHIKRIMKDFLEIIKGLSLKQSQQFQQFENYRC